MAAAGSKSRNHVRSSSSVVPVIPRMFEKRVQQSSENVARVPTASCNRAATRKELGQLGTGHEIQRYDGKGSHRLADQDEQNGQMRSNGDEHVPTPKQSSTNLVEYASNIKPKGSKSERERLSRPSDLSESRPRVSLPSYTHYPTDSHIWPKRALRLRTASFPLSPDSQSEVQGNSQRHSHSRSVHKITFGSFVVDSESSESSPILPPSATSTHFTHPTPMSETRSQASLSEHGDILAKTAGGTAPTAAAQNILESPHFVAYRPGLMVDHALDFFKYRQQFLAQHLQDLYQGNGGDVTLNVCFEKLVSRFNLHSMVICQSPMMATAVQLAVNQKQFGPDGKLSITIGVQDKFTSVNAVETVLKSMYGFSSLDLKALERPFLDPREFYALFAASCLLGLPDHQLFSANCVAQLLNWRTLADVFGLCLTGKKWGLCLEPYPKRSDEITSLLFQPQASFLFDRALATLVQELSRTDFVFHKDAPNISFLGGLPAVPASTDIPLTPQGITFGDLEVGISARDLALSSLLLSLPLSALQRLVADLSVGPNPAVPGVIDSTIQEREKRRLAFSQTSASSSSKNFKEACIAVDFLPNGIGIINEMS